MSASICFCGPMSDPLKSKCWGWSWQEVGTGQVLTWQIPLFPLLAPLVWFKGNNGFNTWVLTPPFPHIHLQKLLVFTPSFSIQAHFSLTICQKKTMGTTCIWSLGTSCEHLLQYSHSAWHDNTLEFGQTGLKRKENDSWPTPPIHIWCSTNSWLLFPMRQVY